MKKSNKILSFFAILSMMFTMIPSIPVKASAEDRVTAFISMFKGEELTREKIKSEDLTEKDVEFFGVYLSNWYVPFYTAVGNKATTEAGDLASDYSSLVRVVSKDTSFSEENAEMLCKVVTSNITQNSTQLDVYGSNEPIYNGGKLEKVDDWCKPNIQQFFSMMAGNTKLTNPKSQQEGGNNGSVSFPYKYAYFFPEGTEDPVKPSFDCITDGTGMTTSQQVFWQCFAELGMDSNVFYSCISAFDLTPEDLPNFNKGAPEDSLIEYFKDGSKKMVNSSADKMYVMISPFGDLLIAGAKNTTIAIPACINPYRWVNTYSEEDTTGIGGDSILALSGPFLSRWNTQNGSVSIGKKKNGGKAGGTFKDTLKSSSINSSSTDADNKDKTNQESASNGGQKSVIMAQGYPVLTVNTKGYIDDIKNTVASGYDNTVIKNTALRETTVVEKSEDVNVQKWQSVSSYPFLNNPKRNNSEDKTWDRQTILSFLKIASNSSNGLGFGAENISIDYDNGTWQLVNINSKNISQMKVDNIKEAFTNHDQWVKKASKSAREGYDQLTQKTGFLSGTRAEDFMGNQDEFYELFNADLQGLKSTVVENQDDFVFAGRDPDQDERDLEKRRTEQRISSDSEDNGKDAEYTMVDCTFDLEKDPRYQKVKAGKLSAFSEQRISNNYGFFPLIHFTNKTTGVNNEADEIVRWFGNADLWKMLNKARNDTYDAEATQPIFMYVDGQSKGLGYPTRNNTAIPTDTSNCQLLTNYVAIDLKGVATDENGQSNTLNVTNFIDVDNEDLAEEIFGGDDGDGSVFRTGDLPEGMDLQGYIYQEQFPCYLYASYLYAGVGLKQKELGYRMSNGNFPDLSNKTLDLSLGSDDNTRDDDILNWVYYLLHPTEGIDYFRIWLTNKMSGFCVGLHDTMVGTTGIGSITGTTRYKNFTGLTTCPTLDDTAFTSQMSNFYNSTMWIVIVIGFIVVFLGYVTNQITMTKMLAYMLVIAIATPLPATLINACINTTNVISSQFYDSKFIYWALIQQQIYNAEIDQNAKSASESYDTYLRGLYKDNADATMTQGSNSITLKWQAYKKLRSVEFSEEDSKDLSSKKISQYNVAKNELNNMLQNSFDAQGFAETEVAYLYRNYIDIANNSRFIYKAIANTYPQLGSDAYTDGMNPNLAEHFSEINEPSKFTNAPKSTVTGDSYVYVTAPLGSRIAIEGFNTINELGTDAGSSLDSRFGISNDAFAFSQKSFNTGATISDTILQTLQGANEVADQTFNPKDYDNADYYSLASYALMSESPYYYFSWYLFSQGLSYEATGGGGYKKLLIGEDNQEFFNYVREDGTPTDYLKDFMDCERLFKYVIPFLRQGNQLVEKWADMNGGIFTYDHIPFTEGAEKELGIENGENPEVAQQYWHNLNTRRMYNCYCPWLDLIDNADYAKEVTVSASGKSYTISNPTDPYSYPEERPMVFSRAQAEEYGYTNGQLTDVELRIIKFEEEARKALFELLNYSNFDDSAINAAASMECTFAFNQAFSESSLTNNSTTLYPLNFEVKDFSYDAYLRYILANNSIDTVGGGGADASVIETMQQTEYGDKLADKGFYQRIVAKSGLFTAILLIINDILAQIVLPIFKYLFIIILFLLMIVEIFVAMWKLAGNKHYMKRMISIAVIPLIKYCLIMLGMSFGIAMLMGNITNPLTGGEMVSLRFGNPDLALFAMIIILCAVDWLLFKTLKQIWYSLKTDTKKVWTQMKGYVGEVFHNFTNMFNHSDQKAGNASGDQYGEGKKNIANNSTIYVQNGDVKRDDQRNKDDFDDLSESQKVNQEEADKAKEKEHAHSINERIRKQSNKDSKTDEADE